MWIMRVVAMLHMGRIFSVATKQPQKSAQEKLVLDFLFAIGQILCVIGLLYGMILSIANWKYSHPIEPRYDPVTGHEWSPETDDPEFQLSIVPVKSVAMIETARSITDAP